MESDYHLCHDTESAMHAWIVCVIGCAVAVKFSIAKLANIGRDVVKVVVSRGLDCEAHTGFHCISINPPPLQPESIFSP